LSVIDRIMQCLTSIMKWPSRICNYYWYQRGVFSTTSCKLFSSSSCCWGLNLMV